MAGSYGRYMFMPFKEVAKLSFKVAVPFYIFFSLAVYKNSSCSTSMVTLGTEGLFNF